MKKKLHLKKTKRHWKRKPAPQVPYRERLAAERRKRHDAAAMASGSGFPAVALAALLSQAQIVESGE